MAINKIVSSGIKISASVDSMFIENYKEWHKDTVSYFTGCTIYVSYVSPNDGRTKTIRFVDKISTDRKDTVRDSEYGEVNRELELFVGRECDCEKVLMIKNNIYYKWSFNSEEEYKKAKKIHLGRCRILKAEYTSPNDYE